jgi:PAS domain S-box-containing protein
MCEMYSLSGGIAILDPSGRIESVNEEFCEITGWSAAAIVGTPIEEIARGADDALDSVSESGERWDGELLFTDEARAVRPMAVRLTPVLDELGEVSGFLVRVTAPLEA